MSSVNDYSMLSRGDVIKTFRKKAGLKQMDLAYFVDKHEKTICRYESNSVNIPDKVFYEIGYVLNIPHDILLQFPNFERNDEDIPVERKKIKDMTKGDFIRAKRYEADMTQRELGSLVNMSCCVISEFENNRRDININKFNLLCAALGVDEKEKEKFLLNGGKSISRQLNCDTTNMTKGEFIRVKRKKAGITQIELASLVNMTNSALSDFENNKRNIGINNFNLLCDALDIDEKEKDEFLQNERKKIIEQLNNIFPCDISNMTIGEKILYLRMLNNLTIPQLAEKSGVSVTGIRKIESSIVTPRNNTIIKLSKALGVDLNSDLHCVKNLNIN